MKMASGSTVKREQGLARATSTSALSASHVLARHTDDFTAQA